MAAQQKQQQATTESREQQFKDRGIPQVPHSEAAGEKPNTLWVCTDQQRFEMIQGLRNTLINTPNLQGFMKEAVTFTNTFVQTPICSPSPGEDAAFGIIGSTVLSPPQREMQFALKINF